jgi:hypothetical protein
MPVELLTAIFEELSRPDVAAATCVCRCWAHVGNGVLWRSPPERIMRQLPAAARRVIGAAHVAELSLNSRRVGRIFATPLPRLRSLHVGLTTILANTQRFCRFVCDHSSGGGSAGGNSGSSAHSASANAATTGTRVLTSVRITTKFMGWQRALPTEAFVVLAHCPGLRNLSVEARVTTEAMQDALSPGGIDGSGSLAARSSLSEHQPPQLLQQQQDHNSAPIFRGLQELSFDIQHGAATLLLPHLRATIVTMLHFNVHNYREIGIRSTASLLRAVARFTQLRRLMLRVWGPGQPPASANEILVLRALRNLRELRLQDSSEWTALTDSVLLDLLRCMRDLSLLTLQPASGLSAGIVPAIGAVCPQLVHVELPTELDTDSFAAFAAQAPTLPNLRRLVAWRPVNVAAINQCV